MNTDNVTAACHDAMVRLLSEASATGDGLDCMCGYAIGINENEYTLSAVQTRDMDMETAATMLGDMLGIYAARNNLTVDEIKGLLLQVVAAKDTILSKQIKTDNVKGENAQ